MLAATANQLKRKNRKSLKRNDWGMTDKNPGRLIIDAPEGAVVLTGLDEAAIGQTTRDEGEVLVYSADKIIDILMKRDGMTSDEALEVYGYNIECLYAGPRTPVLMWEGVEFDGEID